MECIRLKDSATIDGEINGINLVGTRGYALLASTGGA